MENQRKSNDWRKKRKLKPIKTIAFEYRHEFLNMNPLGRYVDQMKCYYNFFKNKDGQFSSHVLSDMRTSSIINFKIKKVLGDGLNKHVVPPHHLEEVIQNESINIETFKKKLSNIQTNMTQNNQTIDNCEQDKCFLCKSEARFINIKIRDLTSILATDIRNELVFHGHLEKRRINNKLLTKLESFEELKLHYLHYYSNEN